MNLTVVSVSVLSLQFQRKSGSILVYLGFHQREILKVFEKMNEVISKALSKYENVIVMGDLNINIISSTSD